MDVTHRGCEQAYKQKPRCGEHHPSGFLFVLLPAATYSPTPFPMQWLCSRLAAGAARWRLRRRWPTWETVWRRVASRRTNKNPDAVNVTHRGSCLYYCRQRPTLPHSFPCSTIGGIRLNFRVRNGNGCDPDPMTTGMLAAWGSPFRSLRELRGGSSQTILSKSA